MITNSTTPLFKKVKKLAKSCCSQEVVADLLDIPIYTLKPDGIYHKAWKLGRAEADFKVAKAFQDMACKDSRTMRLYLASQRNIVEETQTNDDDRQISFAKLTPTQLKKIADVFKPNLLEHTTPKQCDAEDV